MPPSARATALARSRELVTSEASRWVDKAKLPAMMVIKARIQSTKMRATPRCSAPWGYVIGVIDEFSALRPKLARVLHPPVRFVLGSAPEAAAVAIPAANPRRRIE